VYDGTTDRLIVSVCGLATRPSFCMLISMPTNTMCVERLACIHLISTKRVQARGTDEYFSDNNINIIWACLANNSELIIRQGRPLAGNYAGETPHLFYSSLTQTKYLSRRQLWSCVLSMLLTISYQAIMQHGRLQESEHSTKNSWSEGRACSTKRRSCSALDLLMTSQSAISP